MTGRKVLVPPKKPKYRKLDKEKIKQFVSKKEKGTKRKIIGTKKEVFDKIAHHTKSRLTKKDLMISPYSNKVVIKTRYKQGQKLSKHFGIDKCTCAWDTSRKSTR
jgi:hypothetical protein